jgi:hypothetical protein
LKKAFLTDGFKLEVETCAGIVSEVILCENVPGIAQTKSQMPFVDQSAQDKMWLPFGEDIMKSADATLPKADSVQFFFVFALPIVFILLTLLFAGGLAYAVWSVNTFPDSLGFTSVFPETTGDLEEKKILDEINRDELLRMYKMSLLPKEPLPPRPIFFAVTAPLGHYTGDRTPSTFKCRVFCKRTVGQKKDDDKVVKQKENEKEAWQMQVRLFLRRKGKELAYHPLPSSEPGHFTVSDAQVGDRLVAIGRVDPQMGQKLGDLNKLIHLEVVK